MSDLKTYVVGEMSFDPSRDVDALVEEFVRGYYGGAAAPSVLQYLRLMSNSMLENDVLQDIYGNRLCSDPRAPEACEHWIGWANSIFGNKTMLDAAALLRTAAAAATETRHRQRVEDALMHVQYVVLLRWEGLRSFAQRSKVSWPLSETKQEEFTLFAAAFNRSADLPQKGFKHFIQTDHGGTRLPPCDLQCFHDQVFPKSQVDIH